jgi:nucleotide-binding universal stress UspA family protein
MYADIVIAVDGSEESKRAARRGLALARAFDATVHVLHVVERRALGLTTSAEEASRLRDRGEAVLAGIEELAAGSGPTVQTALREGRPAVRIDEFADERDADLVVVGRQGTTGLGRRLLGGVTEGLVHRSDVPVFVVPEGADADVDADGDGYARVLVPTDGSENAEVAVPHAAAVARRYGAVLHVLNVVDIQEAGGVFGAGGLEAAFVDRLEARGREAVERVEDGLRGTDPDLDLETAVVRTASFDGAAAGIREYVADAGIDLLVMGSHGRSNLGRQLLGSVASTVLRTVDVPVLLVKRED